MPIFYTDTGSFNIVEVTGSLTVFSASAAEFQVTNTGVKIGNLSTDTHSITGSVDITGSLNISGSGTQIPFQVSSGSTSLLFVSRSGNIGLGTSSPGVNLHTFSTTTSTNAVTENTRFQLSSTGTTAAGFGQRIGFYGKASTLDNQLYASIDGTFRFITNTTAWGGRLNFNIVNNGVTSTPLQVDANGPGAVNVTGNLTVSSGFTNTPTLYVSTQGNFMNTTTAQTYRTTNGGGAITSLIAVGSRTTDGVGAPVIHMDATNQLVFAAMNNAATPLAIARASIQVSGSNNASGSEAGDLRFLTQAGGTAATEKMRISSTGAITISGSLTFANTSSLGGFNGEVVRFGSGTLVAGQLYFLSSSGTWSLADASSTGSSTGMLGIATGTSPTANGLMVRGFAYSGSYTTSTGSIVYAATSSGAMTITSPSSSNHVVRVVGYVTSIPNTIYFNPDATWVTLA